MAVTCDEFSSLSLSFFKIANSCIPSDLLITFALVLLNANILTLLLSFAIFKCLFLFVLQILSSVVEIVPSYYGIRLAAVASRKEFLDLEKWLNNNLTTYKDVFFEVTLPSLIY